MPLFHSRFHTLRMHPLAAALTLLIASGTASSATAPPASAALHTTGTSERYALRMQQRHAGTSRKPASTPVTRPLSARPADTLPVTSCLDDDDPGTLRNVLRSANEGDTVDLSALTCSTITLTQGVIDTSTLYENPYLLYNVTLQGPGRDALTIDANGQSQVFLLGGYSSDKGIFTVNDLTIANGSYDQSLAACIEGFGGAVVLNRVNVTNCHSTGTYKLLFGGAVDVTTLQMTDSTISNSSVTGTGAHSNASGGGAYVSESATLTRSTVSGNSAIGPYAAYDGYASVGGGLYVRGNLTLIDSSISGNSIEATNDSQDANGGGIYVRGIASISGSTIDGNTADGDGGGIFKAIYSVYGEPGGSNPPTTLTITNSTLSGNTAGHEGGGIATSRPLYLANSTIAMNTAAAGGGGVMFLLASIEDSGGVLGLQSTIVASNTASDGAAFAADIDADDALAVTGANDLVMLAGSSTVLPSDTLASDPVLLPLADNGGLTRTHALSSASPAIDAGNNAAGLEFDQRGAGFARVVGASADIGAFEAAVVTDVIFTDGFDGPAPPG